MHCSEHREYLAYELVLTYIVKQVIYIYIDVCV